MSADSGQTIAPGGTIGILGGGQLGRMAAMAAARLGYRCHIYCPDRDSPASHVAHATTVAAYDDLAALEKFAMGVAFELALACDFRLATESTQLALPEIALGTIPGSGGTQRLARLAGLGRAKEMIMRGRRLGAVEAHAWGVVTEVVPDGALDEAVARWTADMAARPQVPLATLKKVLDETWRSPLDSGLAMEGQAFEKLRFGPEFRHGIDAFLAKKKPDFSKM